MNDEEPSDEFKREVEEALRPMRELMERLARGVEPTCIYCGRSLVRGTSGRWITEGDRTLTCFDGGDGEEVWHESQGDA